MKKTQIGIFIIIGVLLITIFAFTFIRTESISNSQYLDGSQRDIAHVKEHVKSCLSKESEYGYVYSLIRDKKTDDVVEEMTIPTHLTLDFKNDQFIISPFNRTHLIHNMEVFIRREFGKCIDNFNGINDSITLEEISNYSLFIEELKDDNILSGDTLLVQLYYPLRIKSHETVNTIENFNLRIEEVPLELLEQDVNTIINSIQESAQNSQDTNFENLVRHIEEISLREDVIVDAWQKDKEIRFSLYYHTNYYNTHYLFKIKGLTQN